MSKRRPDPAPSLPLGGDQQMAKQQKSDAPCGCYRCLVERNERDYSGLPITATRMILCETCGNKRCPHATDHRLECTGSNDLGQPGSRFVMDNAIPAKHAPCPGCGYYMGCLSYLHWFCTKCGWGGTEAERLAAGQKPRDETTKGGSE